MSKTIHTMSLLLAVGCAYFWLNVPFLISFALQAFGVTLGVYLLIKRLSRAKVWHVAPAAESLEMPLLTFAFLLLIGSTGNLSSLFYPLSFAHLFFLVFSTSASGILLTTAAILLFHVGLTPELTTVEIAGLLSLPLLMVFFLFAKQQYNQARASTQLLVAGEASLLQSQAEQDQVEQFVSEYLQPKLLYLAELARHAQVNQPELEKEIARINQEVTKKIKKLNT